jgi:tRNA1(Val) A37 N6-methylase TrmN6
MRAERSEVSEDAILGGRLVLAQPVRGHRAGHDAVLLAAATAAQPGEQAVDLGAGVGAAGLALAHRVEGLGVTLVEIDPGLAALAHDNAVRNGLAARVHTICLDVAAPAAAFAAAGLRQGAADRVLMNPPFNPPQNPSPDEVRRLAHIGSEAALRRWLGTAARLLRPGGTVTLIWRADRLADVLAAFAADFGAVAILPIHPKPDAPAIRILAAAIKGSRGPPALVPGLVLADAMGMPSAAAEAVLRGGAPLPFARN